jgi:histone-lysine N-methyltransferase SETMAR
MVEFVQQGTTVTSEVHCETLKKLCKVIQSKRHGLLTCGLVLLHDNATHIPALLEHFNWELFDRSPCSPDLALSDYHLFTYLKNWLGSEYFSNNEKLLVGVKMWLSSQVADFFDTGIQKLIS